MTGKQDGYVLSWNATSGLYEFVSPQTGPTGPTGPAGPQGATGATGPAGANGTSGVISVTAPITNSGTSTSAQLGLDSSVPIKSASNTFTKAQVIQPSDAGPALSLINTTRYLTINSYSFSSYYNGDEDVYVTTMNVTPIPGLLNDNYQISVRSLINQYPVVDAYYVNGAFTHSNTSGHLTIYAAQPQIGFTPPVLTVRSGASNQKRFEIGETGAIYIGGADSAVPFPIQTAREGNGGYLSAGYEGQLNWKLGYQVDYPVVPIVTADGKLAVGPAGGFTGQVLTKASNNNYDVEWRNPVIPKIISGYNYMAPLGWRSNSNGSINANTLYAIPLPIYETVTLTRLMFVVNATAAAGAVGRMGIYSSDSNSKPSTLLLDAGTASATTIGTKTITISQTLQPGLYWIAMVAQGQAMTTVQATNNQSSPFVPSSITSSTSGFGFTSYTHSAVSGVLPSTFSIASVANPPVVHYGAGA
jgi:hypothetical protein